MTSSAKALLIPAVLISFALISLITLKSITPELASVQLFFWIIGLISFVIISRFKLSFLKKNHLLAYIGLISLLVITLISSSLTRGTARWIKFGDLFGIQPSQLAIPITGFTLALFANKNKLDNIKNIGKFLGILFLPAILILIEPDLGTTIHFGLSLGIILFLSEIKTKYILSLLSLVLIGIIFSWIVILKPYQKNRITSFIKAHNNQEDSSNYNSFQSQIAVGSGQFYGKGLGQGSQSHLRFLPERQTDFIFASYTEEWGFIGSLILLGLYFILNAFLIRQAIISDTKFEYYYLMVVMTAITIQTFVNVGMNIGLLPITGVTLPFISYGGSSLISLCLMLGLAQNIILKQKRKIKLDIR